jgi:subtilase family serine protease
MSHASHVLSRRSIFAAVAVVVALLVAVALGLVAPPAARSHTGSTGLRPLAVRLHHHWQSPPTTADCLASAGIPCYAPSQLQTAYNLKSLYRNHLDGRGRTIAVVDAFGSPTARADLRRFDRDFGLPAPPRFDIIQPAGRVPAFDPTDPDMAGWAEETSLDVQWAHAIAPMANLLLVETPVSETEGLHGIPEIVKAENYVINHHLADVISQSFGATEETFPSEEALRGQRSALKNAARHHVTMLASSGDTGATDYKLDLDHLYTHRVNSWPSTDPLVTSLGGTQLHLDAKGHRTAPDNVWNDQALFGTAAAGGGGLSHVFARPSYQRSVARVVDHRRGTPDISMSAAVDGGVLVYIGFTGGDGITPGYYIFGGTSEASPEFAGVVAIATQRAHHRLGLLNPTLYALGAEHAPGIVDVTRGNNTVTFQQNGKKYTVPGFSARPGYDLASGLGTVNAAALTRELAR